MRTISQFAVALGVLSAFVACGDGTEELGDADVGADTAADAAEAAETGVSDTDTGLSDVADTAAVGDTVAADVVDTTDVDDEADVGDADGSAAPDVTDPYADVVDVVYEPCTLTGGPTASVSGHAMPFGPSESWTVEAARVTILELPDREAFTGADSSFRFDDIPVGCEVSLVLEAEGRPLIQTGTHVVPAEGIDRLTFQAPDFYTRDLLERFARTNADERMCQIATTATRLGSSLYDATPGAHGEPGVTITIEPTPGLVDGPIYFEMVRYNVIYPLRTLTETTYDGGVLFLNVTPGRYTLRAHKADTEFVDVDIKCRAGYIVNASPPWGLQVVSGGVGPRDPDQEF